MSKKSSLSTVKHIQTEHVIKAKILSEALPYIQEFSGKVITIKLGGAILEENPHRLELFIRDLVLLKTVGIHPVLVHGGGKHISTLLKLLGKESKFIDGLRVTDDETMNISQMVLAGLINKNLVALIGKAGGKAVGLSGRDGAIAKGHALQKKHVDYGRVGEVDEVNPKLIQDLIATGYIPVLAPVASDRNGQPLNINADTFATEIALALQSEKLVFISDVIGVMRDPKDPSTLFPTLTIKEIEPLIKKKIANSGMIPKLRAAKKALANNQVKRVHFISELVDHSLLVELFTEAGVGTVISKSKE